jgi:hypothetical protein
LCGDKKIEFSTCNCWEEDISGIISIARKEFFIQWSQEVRKHRDFKLSIGDIRKFKKYLYSCPISPMSLVQAIYLKRSYFVSVFSEKFSCSDKVAVSIMKCLGYKNFNHRMEYEINGEFCENVLTICEKIALICEYTDGEKVNVP